MKKQNTTFNAIGDWGGSWLVFCIETGEDIARFEDRAMAMAFCLTHNTKRKLHSRHNTPGKHEKV